MLKQITFALIFAIILMAGGAVLAADTANVTATVTVQNVSVSVSDGSVSYGTLGQNSAQTTLALSDTQTATNNGNVAESLNIKGVDSTNWTLAGTAGSDQYVHRFCNDTDLDCTTAPTNYTALTTNYATLDTNITLSGTVDFQLQINTPNPSTNFTEQTVSITVQAIAY